MYIRCHVLAITTFQNQLLQRQFVRSQRPNKAPCNNHIPKSVIATGGVKIDVTRESCNNHIPKSVIATASHLGISTKTLSAI